MRKTAWHGFSAWTLETAVVRVTIVPALGGKLVSLVDQETSYEWLFSPQAPPLSPPYGAVFTDYHPNGWDEMFPTINKCAVPGAPDETLPDHGEVWALPWDVVGHSEDAITLRVRGQQPNYPYTLTRQARLNGNRLRLSYMLDNHADRPLPFLWAAHPLFKGHADIRIDLPTEVKSVVNVMEDHHSLGAIEREADWPRAMTVAGDTKALDRIGDASLNDCRKFYTSPKLQISSARLVHEGIGRALSMRWDAQIAPYLGIWVDEGVYTPETTVALEPGTGYYDSLTTAIDNACVATVAAGESAQWWIEVELGAI